MIALKDPNDVWLDLHGKAIGVEGFALQGLNGGDFRVMISV